MLLLWIAVALNILGTLGWVLLRPYLGVQGGVVAAQAFTVLLALCIYAVLLTIWVYLDAKAARRPAALPALAALFAWPLALPIYLLATRGARGLFPAAGVLTALIVPCGLISPALSVRHAVKGAHLVQEAQQEKSPEKALAAVAEFEKAQALAENNLESYRGLFEAAFSADRMDLAEKYYGILQRLGKDRRYTGFQLAGWHAAAATYAFDLCFADSQVVLTAFAKHQARPTLDAVRGLVRHGELAADLRLQRETALQRVHPGPYRRQMETVKLQDVLLSDLDRKTAKFRELLKKTEASPDWLQAFDSYCQGLAAADREFARQQFTQAAQLRVDYADPRIQLAEMLLEDGHNDSAFSAAQDVISLMDRGGFALRPETVLADSYEVSAAALYRKGRPRLASKRAKARTEARKSIASAIDYVGRALRLQPENKKALKLRDEMRRDELASSPPPVR